MKRIFLLALIGVGMTAAIFQVLSGSEAAQQSYRLVCRGSANLPIGTAPGEGNIGFAFTRGTKPASQGLAPGECSWENRGMHADEPDRLSQHVAMSLKAGPNLPSEKVRLPSILTNRWYEELHSPDKYWTFTVYNDRQGQLIATSARPNPGMDVSPTARVPSKIGQIIRPDLPRARTPGDETPKIIALKGPSDPSSRTRLLESLTGGLKMNVPPAPGALSREEQMGLLKSAGLEALSEPPTPYATLTPEQPHVAGRGDLTFLAPLQVDSGINDNIAEFRLNADFTGWLDVRLNFETKGMYLVTFTVYSTSYDQFVIRDPEGHFTEQIFPDKKPKDWQHLIMIVEVTDPGNYYFKLTHEAKPGNHWYFRSCEVATWKK